MGYTTEVRGNMARFEQVEGMDGPTRSQVSYPTHPPEMMGSLSEKINVCVCVDRVYMCVCIYI